MTLQNTYKGNLGRIVEKQIQDIRNSIDSIENEFKLLFDNMLCGCVYSRFVTDENGNPINYVPMAVNKPFPKIVAKEKAEERLQMKKEEVEAQIQEWKVNREINKLDRRAEKSEEYAVAAIDFAAAAVAEADLATLEAIEARLIAEAVKADT